MQKQQQLKGDKSEKIELCVCRPGRLGARSQVGPEFLHVALHCALTKNIFWNRECRHLALDFAGSHCVQCIFLLMKAEQVPSLNKSGSFVEKQPKCQVNVLGRTWEAAQIMLQNC